MQYCKYINNSDGKAVLIKIVQEIITIILFYYRIGADESMGCVGIGTSYIGTGKEHWLDMLDNARKPVAQWHTLGESIPGSNPATSNSSMKFNCLTGR